MDRRPAIHNLWTTIFQYRNLSYDIGLILRLRNCSPLSTLRLCNQRKVAPGLLFLIAADSRLGLCFLDLWKILIGLLDELIARLSLIFLLDTARFER